VEGLRLDKPRFLNKSSIGFIVFNVFIYLVLTIQVITIEVTDSNTKVDNHMKQTKGDSCHCDGQVVAIIIILIMVIKWSIWMMAMMIMVEL